MRRELKLDWLTLGLYIFFVVFGWLNIYAASTNDASLDLFNLSYNYGKQFVFVVGCLVMGIALIQFIDVRDVEFTAYIVYGLTVLALLAVAFFGREVNGARAWFELGGFRFQPGEFAKLGVLLALAKVMSQPLFSLRRTRDRLVVAAIIGVPILLILKQNDTGTALVYLGLVLMLYREGLSPLYLIAGFLLGVFGIMALLVDIQIVLNLLVALTFGLYIYQARNRRWFTHLVSFIGLNLVLFLVLVNNPFSFQIGTFTLTHEWLMIALDSVMVIGFIIYLVRFRIRQWSFYVIVFVGFVFFVGAVDFIFERVLQPHQRNRIEALFNPEIDPNGINWNTRQSKIAIGSGGLVGKGYLQGTQTKFDFVPQQHTDFIFCTIGEEWGWVGSTVLIVAFFLFLAQLLFMAEECKSKFGRVFTYGVACLFFVHIAINIAMTIGLAPVIGIPLPFFSYGGSSLITFSLMYFLAAKFYAVRTNVLAGGA